MKILKKLFQSKKVLVVNDILNEVESTIIENTKHYPKEVLEIHNEFNTAADLLLKEANDIIEQSKDKDFEKVNRLKSIGFKQANQVTELQPVIEKVNLSKEQIELLNYYKINYPNNKFITEEQVKSICYKYNLVCGDVERYKGFVPEKNLRDIEKFKLKNEDIVLSAVLWGKQASKKRITISIKKYNSLLKNCLIHGDGKDNLDNDNRWCKAVDVDYPQYSYCDNISKIGLQICAPVKDMDISGLELIEGYKLQKKHIPDPVVLQPVNGGYLIITAWGDESEDPIVVNNQFN